MEVGFNRSGGNTTRILGYYPLNGVNPYTTPSDVSALVDDSGHDYDIKVDISVSASNSVR